MSYYLSGDGILDVPVILWMTSILRDASHHRVVEDADPYKLKRFFITANKKRHFPKEMPLFLPLWITLPAQPCWNGGIWYKRTHGTESR